MALTPESTPAYWYDLDTGQAIDLRDVSVGLDVETESEMSTSSDLESSWEGSESDSDHNVRMDEPPEYIHEIYPSSNSQQIQRQTNQIREMNIDGNNISDNAPRLAQCNIRTTDREPVTETIINRQNNAVAGTTSGSTAVSMLQNHGTSDSPPSYEEVMGIPHKYNVRTSSSSAQELPPVVYAPNAGQNQNPPYPIAESELRNDVVVTIAAGRAVDSAVIRRPSFHYDPVSVYCTHCILVVTSEVEMEITASTWCVFCFCLLCCICLAWVPFVSDSFKTANHYCPLCRNKLGHDPQMDCNASNIVHSFGPHERER